ncbi:hypothetical protein C1280_33365 [Gemmata obscuriglobus]|uniref:Ice-binding protein C-terminal domain-containing protein n=2 Tax=Gemmata TaxID=113 RepID=A0A2Z3H944_9BACT|nr:hypothetical protein C1280_33365 [Gemmata obscuriglobus]
MWGALAVLLAGSAPAQAFYWYDWPGSRVPREPTLLNPTSLLTPDTPREPTIPNPPSGPPVPVDKPPIGPPEHTPEPSTGLIGLIGLGAVAARKWWKKR